MLILINFKNWLLENHENENLATSQEKNMTTTQKDVTTFSNNQRTSSSNNTSFDIDEILVKQLVQNFGPDVYFNLDVAKERLIQDAQSSAKDIAAAIEHYSKLMIPENTNITRAIMAYFPPNIQKYKLT